MKTWLKNLKELIDRFGDKVKYPLDVACEIDGERVDIDCTEEFLMKQFLTLV